MNFLMQCAYWCPPSSSGFELSTSPTAARLQKFSVRLQPCCFSRIEWDLFQGEAGAALHNVSTI